MYASDISEQAIALSVKNAQHNGISNTHFIQSDLFADIPNDVQFDLIVSNPPYITPDEYSQLDESVTKWEDKRALMADDQGLALIKKIINHTPKHIKANDEMEQHSRAQLIIEIGYAQGDAVQHLMTEAGYTHVLAHQDLEKKDRIVSGRIDNVATTKTE